MFDLFGIKKRKLEAAKLAEEKEKCDALKANLEPRITAIAEERFHKTLDDLTDEELYLTVMAYVKELTAVTHRIDGPKKVYYISAEFLIGKLLSNNLINLGIYNQLENLLLKHGKKLSVIEEIEPEPSLGNGGLGRLAACFLDSIATLGLPGDGIGLNYHFGLFQQKFVDRLQTAEPNPWIEKDSWLTKTDTTFEVAFGDRKVKSRLYDIDVIGYENGVLGGLVSALNVFCSRGDNVLVHSPTYIGFTNTLRNNGYHIVHSPLICEETAPGVSRWRMDYDDMERKIREQHIHAAVFCSPHNPCGCVWEREELERAFAIFEKYEVNDYIKTSYEEYHVQGNEANMLDIEEYLRRKGANI